MFTLIYCTIWFDIFMAEKDILFFISSPYVEDAASASFNDLENQPDISPAAGNTGLPSHQGC